MKKAFQLLLTAAAILLPCATMHAQTKISDLATLSAPASGDYLMMLDVSDTSMAVTGTNKKITLGTITDYIGDTEMDLTLKHVTASDWTGGSVIELTSFSLRSSAVAYDLNLASDETLTADRTLKFTLGDTDRRITLGGDFTSTGDILFTGAYDLNLTMTGNTSLTLPTTGTLGTLAGAETLTNKTIDLASNTVTGTKADFNTAVSDDNPAYVGTANSFSGNNTFSGTITSSNTTASTTLTAAIYTAGGLTTLKDSHINTIDIGRGPGDIATCLVVGGDAGISFSATGDDNTAIGYRALGALVGNFDGNTALGASAGFVNVSGASATSIAQCTLLGAETKTNGTTDTNSIVIGYGAKGWGTNTSVFGNASTTFNQMWGTGVSRGYIWGLTLSNNGSDATNDIDIAAGEARDSTGVCTLKLASGITKQLDAAWAVGTNAGGLDTGAIANTTYHVWLIMRSDSGVVDVLFSTSATAPTMPANYDYKRRIGAIVRAGGTILAFTQDGDFFSLTTPVLDVNTSSLTTSRMTLTLSSMPTGIRMRPRIRVFGNNASTSVAVLVMDLNETDSAPANNAAPGMSFGTNVTNMPISGPADLFTNTSAQIGARATAASTTLRITTCGWIDTRGKNGSSD